jgi:GntR family transcriptional regulator
MPQLNKTSALPLYFQLAKTLRDKIRAGEYAKGDQIASERELMDQFQVSRNTVRDAIDCLVNEGLLVREHGRGTFVGDPTLKLGLMRLTSFTEDMHERHQEPSSKMISSEVLVPPPSIQKQLNLLPGEKAFKVIRLRFADGIPMALNISFFSLETCPGLIEENLEKQSVYEVLEKKFGVRIARAEQIIRADSASEYQADMLGVSEGVPILVIEGVVLQEDGRPIEHLCSIYRSDRYVFSINPVRVSLPIQVDGGASKS